MLDRRGPVSVEGAVDEAIDDVAGNGDSAPPSGWWTDEGVRAPGDVSFYQQHKTAIWVSGGVAVALGVGAYLIWGRE